MTDYVKQLMGCLRPDRQVLIFSNTLSSYVRSLCASWCNSAVEVSISPPYRIAEVSQKFERVPDEPVKRRLLCPILDKLLDRSQRGLVLVRTSNKASALTADLRSHGYPALMVDDAPKKVISRVVSGEASILVCCDTTLQALTSVPVMFHLMVQFDMPSEVGEYLAMLWMLIRPDFTGESVSLVMPTERILASKVNVLMHKKRQRKAVSWSAVILPPPISLWRVPRLTK